MSTAELQTVPDYLEEQQIRDLMDAWHIDTPQKVAVLLAYAHTGSWQAAQRAIGLCHNVHYLWRNHDPNYAAAIPVVTDWMRDNLEGEIRHRAMVGDERGVYFKGQKIDTYRQKSDLLLIFAAKGEFPEKYRDNIHVTGEITTVKAYGFDVDKV